MNNNRNNNNTRRRGRGNRNQGGGNQNRIDSRARGNAPQLLDKYKKLAQDAHHNGDRVQMEYYLQFADHYFRVIADNKARQDEARGGNRTDRDDDDASDGEDDFDVGNRQQGRGIRSDRNDRTDRNERSDRGNRQRGNRRDFDDRDDRDERSQDDDGNDESDNGETDFEPANNPFTRSNRGRNRDNGHDTVRESSVDEGNRRPRGRRTAPHRNEGPTGDEGEIDLAVLPPSISAASADAEETAPKRKLAPRRRKAAAPEGDEGDTLKAVG